MDGEQISRTPLLQASMWGYGAVVHALIEARADVNAAAKVPAQAARCTYAPLEYGSSRRSKNRGGIVSSDEHCNAD